MSTSATPPTPGGARRPRLETTPVSTTPVSLPATPPPATPPPATPPPAANNREVTSRIALVALVALLLFGVVWSVGRIAKMFDRQTVVTPAAEAPRLVLPPAETQLPAAVGAFRPVSPDKRFLQLPSPAIENGNTDGSTAVQWTDDVGIIYPRPPGPNHTKDSILAAAQKAGLEVLARENQNCSLSDYVLADWPSNKPLLDSSGKQIVTGGVPQVEMFKVLRSPNVTGIRHKNDPPTGSGGAMRPGSVEGGQSMPNRSGPPQGQPGMGKGPRQQSSSGGNIQTAGNTSVCPSCGDRGVNTPPRPFPCRKCGTTIN